MGNTPSGPPYQGTGHSATAEPVPQGPGSRRRHGCLRSDLALGSLRSSRMTRAGLRIQTIVRFPRESVNKWVRRATHAAWWLAIGTNSTISPSMSSTRAPCARMPASPCPPAFRLVFPIETIWSSSSIAAAQQGQTSESFIVQSSQFIDFRLRLGYYEP